MQAMHDTMHCMVFYRCVLVKHEGGHMSLVYFHSNTERWGYPVREITIQSHCETP